MRKTIWVIASALLLTACKKEVSPIPNAARNNITQQPDSTKTVSKNIDSTNHEQPKIETFDFVTELCVPIKDILIPTHIHAAKLRTPIIFGSITVALQ